MDDDVTVTLDAGLVRLAMEALDAANPQEAVREALLEAVSRHERTSHRDPVMRTSPRSGSDAPFED